MVNELSAKDAFEHADLTFRNNVCGIPELLILSRDKEKVYAHVMNLIEKQSMRGEFYLNLMVYGVKTRNQFMDIAQRLKDKHGYSLVIVNGTKDDSIMNVLISWKNVRNRGYKACIKYTSINI